MNLDEAQRKTVSEWIAAGLKLSEIQSRLATDLGIRMTYMDVRLLVDDLKLTPKDVERSDRAATAIGADGAATSGQGGGKPPVSSAPTGAEPAAAAKSVSLSVDQIARPGAVVSGQVTFTDGQKAEWYFDETGRLGLVPQQQGYRPPAADLQQFQAVLESELSRMGF